MRRSLTRSSPMRLPAFCRMAFAPEHGVEVLTARFYGHAYDRHFHDAYAVGVTDAGHQAFHARGARHVSTRGTVIAFAPGDVHDGEAAGDDGFAYRMLYVPESVVAELASDALERPVDTLRFAAPLVRDAGVRAAVSAAIHALGSPDCPLSRFDALGRLVINLARVAGVSCSAPATGREPGAVARARALLHARFAEPLTIDDVVRDVGLGRFRLTRAFTRALSLPPHAYLMSIRLNEARRRLADGGRPADVAMACGFADQAHLTREFRRRIGITPGAYRRVATLRGA